MITDLHILFTDGLDSKFVVSHIVKIRYAYHTMRHVAYTIRIAWFFGLSVCWTHWRTLQIHLNRLVCRLGRGLKWAQGNTY